MIPIFWTLWTLLLFILTAPLWTWMGDKMFLWVSGKKPITTFPDIPIQKLVPTLPYRHQYILNQHLNGNQEIICVKGGISKITFNTGDTIWMKGDQTIAVQPADHNGRVLKYTDDNLLPINAVKFPTLTPEAESHLNKQEMERHLKIDPHYYDEYLKGFLPEQEITEKIVRHFFQLSVNKE